MKINSVDQDYNCFTNQKHPASIRIKKSCCLDKEYWKNIGNIIIKIALGILIFPLFFKSYYSNIKNAIEKFKLYKIQTKKTPETISNSNPFDLVIANVRRAAKYKDQSEFLSINEKNKNCEEHLGAQSLKAKEKFETVLKNKHNDHPLIKRSMGVLKDRNSLQWSMYMPGVALIATYLRKKHNLNDLYVCDTLLVFQETLKNIVASPKDVRTALIVPTRTLVKGYPDKEFQSQHKLAVCAEKKQGKINIAVLDTQPGSAVFSLIHGNFLNSFDKIEGNILSPAESIFWAINNCCFLRSDNTKLYFTNVMREFAFGCETFALRDAVSFLQNPDFFTKISVNKHPIKVQGIKIERINLFPPEFMKGTQSIQILRDYMKDNPKLANCQMRHKSEHWSLKDCLSRHEIRINRLNKKQNHYTTSRTYKYHLLLLEAIENMKTDDLVKFIKESLLEAPHDQFKDGSTYPLDDFEYLMKFQ